MTDLVPRQQLTADANHTIHVALPPEMGDEVEIFVFPCGVVQAPMSLVSLALAKRMDESGFAKNVLNSPEEDCWNDL